MFPIVLGVLVVGFLLLDRKQPAAPAPSDVSSALPTQFEDLAFGQRVRLSGGTAQLAGSGASVKYKAGSYEVVGVDPKTKHVVVTGAAATDIEVPFSHIQAVE